MTADDYAENLAWWEERAALHPQTEMYRPMIGALREGGNPLRDVELREVGDVAGKRLLHLQCHIGTDTLGWARLGAAVTGVDFSPTALAFARRLSSDLKLPATFIESTIERLPEVHEGSYDIVFASYGALLWLRDLGAWATTIERFLAPGGFFYIVDGHPLASGLSNDAFSNGAEARFEMPYFTSAHPNVFDVGGTYAEAGVATTHNRTKEWSHSLSEIISVLLERGLVIELFQEHRHCAWPIFDSVVRDQAGDYRLPANLEDRLPLMFSMRARKPDAG